MIQNNFQNEKNVFCPLTIGILFFTCLLYMFYCVPQLAYAKSKSENVVGKIYEFGEDDDYEFSSAKPKALTDGSAETYGTFSISGNIHTVTDEDGIPAYGVSRGNLSFSYIYDDSLLKADEDKKHVVKDKGKKIDGIKLDSKISKGALLLQTSRDGKTWNTIAERTNLFEDVPKQTKPFYNTENVQLANGFYYRVIIAYKTGILTDSSKILFVTQDEYSYTKYAEVYVFRAYNEEAAKVDVPENSKRYNLGSKVRTERIEGYSGEKQMANDDPHIGWEMGQFFVGGFTDVEEDKEKNMVFLKDTGDRLSLWFELQQNIDACNNNDRILVVADDSASDTYFEVPGGVNETMDFGRGTLIIRKINPDNTKGEPLIYTNFLEAVASPKAITKVDLFEEGDYEVALDYKLKYDRTKVVGFSVLPKEACYKIYFKFSVRNANSMIFLFDSKTGSELSNGSITENGFRLDAANSKYLDVNVKREVLKDGFNGLTEDTKHNSKAKDGDIFTDEGIYTITVSAEYADTATEKKVYVGKDNLLKAHVTTGLSIEEINEKLAMGATIEDDGTIVEPIEDQVITNTSSSGRKQKKNSKQGGGK